MKEIIKNFGTDTGAITRAIYDIASLKDESPEFVRNLLNATTNTEEYKKASENKNKMSKNNER